MKLGEKEKLGDLVEFYKIINGFEEINWQEKTRIRLSDIGPKLRKSNIYREKASSTTKTTKTVRVGNTVSNTTYNINLI